MDPLALEPADAGAPSAASSSSGEHPQRLLLNADIVSHTKATRREALLLLMFGYSICSLDRLNISTAQLQMGEDCDERPGDRIPAFGSAGPADVIVNGVTYIPKGSASPGKRKEPAHDDADKPNLKKANRGSP